MKGRSILLDADATGRRGAALVVDGRLEDLLIDPPAGDTAPAPGEIFLARIERLAPKLGGAFLRLTPGHNGFLRETRGIREGEGLLVQVVSHPEPGKAAAVTRRVLHKGRRLILTPETPGINVSRQIRDAEEARRLTGAVEAGVAAAGRAGDETLGLIVRTAAEGADAAELTAEVSVLLARHERLLAAARGAPAGGGTALEGAGAWEAALREWSWPRPESLVAAPAAWNYLTAEEENPLGLHGDLRSVAERFRGADLFDQFGVWDEIDRLRVPHVALPSGGSLVVEPTAALVAADVNTGGDTGAAAGVTANVEAARELPRQLRLRGLGGQVVVDFAPMRKMDRHRLEDTLKAALKRDGIETVAHGWTQLGLFELQRKRERRPLADLL